MRDGRGTPGRYVPRNHQPRLRLADLLRRRRTTLKAFMGDLGLTTHEALSIYCDNLGVQSPTHEEFHAVFPVVPQRNSAAEGIVVLEAPTSVEPDLSTVEDVAARDAFAAMDMGTVPTETSPKRPRRKKEETPVE